MEELLNNDVTTVETENTELDTIDVGSGSGASPILTFVVGTAVGFGISYGIKAIKKLIDKKKQQKEEIKPVEKTEG